MSVESVGRIVDGDIIDVSRDLKEEMSADWKDLHVNTWLVPLCGSKDFERGINLSETVGMSHRPRASKKDHVPGFIDFHVKDLEKCVALACTQPFFIVNPDFHIFDFAVYQPTHAAVYVATTSSRHPGKVMVTPIMDYENHRLPSSKVMSEQLERAGYTPKEIPSNKFKYFLSLFGA